MSLAVGFGAGLLITVIGTVLGIIAGYKGGVIDEVISFFTNMILVIPNLPLLLVLAAFIGQASPLVIAIILGFTSWAWGVRVTRSETLSIRQRDFVKSAEMLGEPGWRIMAFEIFPNLISIVGINFIGSVIFAVITEATLEFLGLGDPQHGLLGHHALQRAERLGALGRRVVGPALALRRAGACSGSASRSSTSPSTRSPTRACAPAACSPAGPASCEPEPASCERARPLDPQPLDRLRRRRDRFPCRQERELRHRARASSSASPANPAAARAPSPSPSAACTARRR